MPRYIFPAGSVTNTTGTPLRLTFYGTNTTKRREADLWTIDGSNNLVQPVSNGIVVTDASGNYSAFAGPDDVDALYVNPHTDASRTKLTAAAVVPGTGDTLLPSLFGAGVSTVINVKDAAYGAKGDGTTDDTSAIQAAINASVAGQTVVFPTGTYIISAPILFKGGRSYLGSGHGYGGVGSTIKQKNNANISNPALLSGLFVAEEWHNNSTGCGGPVSIENLCFDGNKASNLTSTACGVILMNFWSRIANCQIKNAPKHGIHLTDTGADGSTQILNSASENRINNCRIDTTGGHGISQISNNGISNQDGFCTDNIVTAVSGDGISFGRGSGWVFRRNHLYGVQGNGINLDNCYATIVRDNEVEDFANANQAGAYYVGINVKQLNGRGSLISGNFIGCTEPTANAVGGYQYVTVTAGTSQTTAQVIVTDNHLAGSGTNKGVGLVFQSDSGGVLGVRRRANRVLNVNTVSYIDGSSKVYEEDWTGVEHAVTNAGTTAYGGVARGSSPGNVTFSGNDFNGSITFGTGTSPTSGVACGLNFEKAFASAPTVVLSPGNAATAAIWGSAGFYASPGTSFCDVKVNSALTASQSQTTYVVNYRVTG